MKSARRIYRDLKKLETGLQNQTNRELASAYFRATRTSKIIGKHLISQRKQSAMQDRDPFTRYHSFMRGWRAGATASVRDPAMFDNADVTIREEYEAGFERGTKDRRALHAEVCERTGYKPTILRAQ